jgi:hypothetical protein
MTAKRQHWWSSSGAALEHGEEERRAGLGAVEDGRGASVFYRDSRRRKRSRKAGTTTVIGTPLRRLLPEWMGWARRVKEGVRLVRVLPQLGRWAAARRGAWRRLVTRGRRMGGFACWAEIKCRCIGGNGPDGLGRKGCSG